MTAHHSRAARAGGPPPGGRYSGQIERAGTPGRVATDARGAAGSYLAGVRLLGRGLTLCARAPRLLVLGMIPVAVTGLLFAGAFAALLFFLGDLAGVATWFAADWPELARGLTRALAAVAILGVALLVGVTTFTAVTLVIGEPFYERISGRVEQWCGGGPGGPEPGFWRSLWPGLVDSARLVAAAAAAGVGLFAAGFLPAVGQTVVPVLGATIAGWFLALELVGIPFTRRGLRLRDRRRALRSHRATALGFGTAVFGCFLVPGAAVLVMPAAVAGGTLLARQVLGQPDRDRAPAPPAARHTPVG
jgi:CysZ protein